MTEQFRPNEARQRQDWQQLADRVQNTLHDLKGHQAAIRETGGAASFKDLII